tara:strand:+ start:434 stop:625 length:192 start_codon:yes stop_codon:yes gene_type:complete
MIKWLKSLFTSNYYIIDDGEVTKVSKEEYKESIPVIDPKEVILESSTTTYKIFGFTITKNNYR